jgi:hypothetical protein
VIALSDENSSLYVEEIKKRRYTKEFHSFVKCCVATRVDKIIIFDLFRCSIDELLTHQFVKHPKKMSNDPNILADDMAKILGFYKEKESNNSETNIDQIFGKEKTKKKFIYLFLF